MKAVDGQVEGNADPGRLWLAEEDGTATPTCRNASPSSLPTKSPTNPYFPSLTKNYNGQRNRELGLFLEDSRTCGQGANPTLPPVMLSDDLILPNPYPRRGKAKGWEMKRCALTGGKWD
jgi:hypothetical protein